MDVEDFKLFRNENKLVLCPIHSDNEEIHSLQLTSPASQSKLVRKERPQIKLEQALQALGPLILAFCMFSWKLIPYLLLFLVLFSLQFFMSLKFSILLFST